MKPQSERQRDWRDRCNARGVCHCGEPTELNRRTGRHYLLCFRHRIAHAAAQSERDARRRESYSVAL